MDLEICMYMYMNGQECSHRRYEWGLTNNQSCDFVPDTHIVDYMDIDCHCTLLRERISRSIEEAVIELFVLAL